MKKINLFIIVAIAATTITGLGSCKKSEDKPNVNPYGIIGSWQANSYKINGEEYLKSTYSAYFYCSGGKRIDYVETYIANIKWAFNANGNWLMDIKDTSIILDTYESQRLCKSIFQTETDQYADSGKWQLSVDKKSLKIFYSDGSPTEDWQVISLNDKTLSLEMMDSGDKLAITLIKL